MSNLFKYTKRVLTSVLAAAVVLTAIPSTAFGAELPDEDFVEAVEVQEEAEVAEVSEDAETTDGIGNEEVIIEGEEETPDRANEDIKVTLTNSEDGNLVFYSKSGDDYDPIPAPTSNYLMATSDMDFTVYIKAADGYKFPTGDNAKLILTYGDYSEVEAHTENKADSADAKYKNVAAQAVAQAADTYSVGGLFVGADGESYYPVTFKAAFFKKLLYIKGGEKRAQDAANKEIFSSTLTVKAPDAADDTITVNVVKGQGGKYDLNTATMDDSLFEATKGNLYKLQLSGTAGLIRGGDKATIAAGGVSASDLTLEVVKSDGTVEDDIPVVNAGSTADKLLKGMAYTNSDDATKNVDAADSTAIAVVSDNTLWKTVSPHTYTGAPSILNDNKTLFVHADVIDYVYADKDLSLRLTVGKAEKTVKKYTFTGTSTSLVKVTAGTGITDGKFIAADEATAADVQFNVAVDETAKGQDWMTPAGYRTIDEIVWTVAGKDPVKVAGTGISQDVTVEKEKLTGNMTVTATTKETVCTEAGNFYIYNKDGKRIGTGTQTNVDTVKTNDSYSFTIVPKLGYALADSKGVTYRIGNSTTDLEPTKTTKDGVTTYTVSGVDNTLDIKVTTVADSNAKNATITSGTAATVKDLAGNALTESTHDNAEKDQIFYFTVVPADNTAVTAVTYTMEDASGTAGASKAAVVAGKDASTGVVTYRTQEAVTGNVVIDVKDTTVINVYGAANDKVDVYAIVAGESIKLSKDTATQIRTDNDLYFRVEPKSDKTTIDDLSSGDDIDIQYHVEDSSTRGDEASTTNVDTPISAKGNGSIGSGALTAGKHLFFIVATTTEKEYGKDFVAYFSKESGTIAVSDQVNAAKDELLGQSVKLAQSEEIPLEVTVYPDSKVIMDKGDTPAVDTSKMHTALTVTTTWSVEKDTKTKGQIAAIDSGDDNNVITSTGTGTYYAKFATGTDNIVATSKTAESNFNVDSYVAKLPLVVAPEYTDYQVKPTLAKGSEKDDPAVTSMNREGSTVYFTVEGKSGRTGEWVDVTNTLATTATDIGAVAWSATPDQSELLTKLYDLDTTTDATTNQSSIDFSGVTSDALTDVTVKATVTMRDGKTKVEKSAKVNVVDATNGYYLLPVVTVTGGDEYFGARAIANLDLSNHGHGLALQKSGTMSDAKITYRVFELTDDGKTECDNTYGSISAMGDTLLISEAAVKQAVEEDEYFADVTKNAKFSAMTLTNGHGSSTTKPYTDNWAAYGKTAAEYSKNYLDTPTLSGNVYSLAAKEMTGVDSTDSDCVVYVKASMNATVNDCPAGYDFAYFTVANEFPTTDIKFVLKDDENKDSDDKVIVQKLTGYLPEYTNVQLLDTGVEVGRVVKDVVLGSKINLPTEAMLATTTGSSRKLLGFNDGVGTFAPGEEVIVEAGKTYTAVWAPKYEFEGLYNKNNAVTEDGVTTYGATWAGWDPTSDSTALPPITPHNVSPAMSATGVVPVIAKIKTTKGYMSQADYDKYDAMGIDNPYPGIFVGDEYFDEAYVETGVKVEFATTATADQKAAVTISGDRQITAVKAPKDDVPLVASYTVGSDKYLMKTGTSTFNGAIELDTLPVATYVITAPDPKPVYYVGQTVSDTGLNVTVTNSGANHGLIAKNITVTSSNTGVVKVEVDEESLVSASQIVPLDFTPVKAGTATISMSIKDSEGIETAEPTTFEVEVKDEGITFEFYAVDGTTKITKLDAKANNSSADKFIIRAKQNGSVLQNMTGWTGSDKDGTVVIGFGSIVNEDDGFGKVVPVTTDDVLQSDGYAVISATSASNITYDAKIPVRTYRTVTFGNVSGTAKEILVNGTAYKTGDPAKEANYPVKVFEDDKNADDKYDITLSGISATAKAAGMEFIGWTDGEGVLDEPAMTGKVTLAMGADAALTANFAPTVVTIDGITEGQTVVVTPESKDTNHKQFNLGITPYDSPTQLTVVPEKIGFFKITDGALSGDYDPTTGSATAVAVNVTPGSTAQGRRIDQFYVGTFKNTAGSTKVEIKEKATPNRTLKTFNLVATGANFADPATPAVAEITKYVDYSSTKGAYEVTLDKRAVKSADGTTVNQDVYFDKDGKPVANGVVTLTNGDGKTYLVKNYLLAYGSKGGSFVTVDGKQYFVDENGIATTAALVTVDGKQYYVNSEGVKITAKDAVNGKYTDPVTNVTYLIASDDTAEQDDKKLVQSVSAFSWTPAKAKDYNHNTSVVKATVTVTFKMEKAGTTDSETLEATVSKDSSASVSGKDVYKATVTAAGYYTKDGEADYDFSKVTDTKTYRYDPSSGQGKGEGFEITGLETEYEYTGKPIKPEVTVTDSATDTILVKGTDYTVKYENNKNVGTATVIVTGKGNYGEKGGTASATFKIVDPTEGETASDYFTVKSVKVTSKDGFIYGGDEKYPAALTIKTDAGDVTASWSGSSYDLSNTDKDLHITVSNNVNKGSGIVAVTGNNGKGAFVTKTATFAIKACDLSAAGDNLNVTASPAAWAVKGAKAKVEVTFMSETLVEGRDYTLAWSYSNKKNAGTGAGKVTVKGKGNFTKKAEQTFDITPFQIEKVDSVAAYAGLKKSAIKVTMYDGDGVVIPAKNYSVETKVFSKTGLEISDAKYKLQAGDKINVTVKAANSNLDGEETLADIVVGANLAKAKITVPKSFTKTFTGEAIELDSDDFGSGKIQVGSYEYGEDFIITGYQNNVKKGTMTVFIQGVSDKVSGVSKFKVKIVPKKITPEN